MSVSETALGPTVAHVWRRRVELTPHALAFEYPRHGAWLTMSWEQADRRVRAIAAGLLALGLDPGDRVALLASTRLEWILADRALLCAGGVTTTLYPSSTADECAWILSNSEASFAFVEDATQLEKIRPLLDDLAFLRTVVLLDGDDSSVDRTVSLDALENRGRAFLEEHPDALDARIDALRPDDLATLIYTSGTTGPPKGVMLTHDNWVYEIEALQESAEAYRQPDDKQYVFLPLAHAFGQIVELMGVALGVPTAVNGDLEGLLAGLRTTRPTMMAAVPRVFEKIHDKIHTTAQEAGGLKVRVFRWAVRVGEQATRHLENGSSPPLRQRLAYRVARRLVFRKLREALGGRMRIFVSGGAPLAPEIARFFCAAGMTILEGYGLTETAAGAVANRYDDFRFGTVGRPFPGSELRIAPDGEVLLRGRHIMRGYWRNEAATREAIDAEGWFHTGDLGELDPDGYLKITGRKKDLIITAGGKNIAPQPIENQIKATCPLVQEVVMHGDRRPYCVALVWVDEEAARGWAARAGVVLGESYAEVARSGPVHDEVWRQIQQVNATLPSYATLKKVQLLDTQLTPESPELTPSMKVRRNVVEERYADLLAGLYAS